MSTFREVGKVQVKNKAGVLRGHQVDSTVTALRTHVYSSAPKRTRTAVWALRGPRPGPLDDGGGWRT